MNRFESAKAQYEALGVNVEAALEQCAETPISLHCWQGDDVTGFDNPQGGAGDGLAVTGNYPGRARNFAELTSDLSLALTLIPGKKRLNLHACYAIFPEGQWADRDALKYEHYLPWVDYAKEQNLGLDFNPTVFSHPKMKDGLSLSSPDAETRAFWVRHCIACRQIAQQMGAALDDRVLCNLWIPDGYKDTPSDRLGPRLRLMESLDKIFAERCPNVIDSVESKVFAIGVESYTVGSAEFYLSYAARHPGVYPLLDNGHYHPLEYVSDKIPALLPFFEILPLHITRGVRWDSDHVVLFDDELREIMKEIVRNDALGRVRIGLDFFDASINRVAAWVIGARSAQKGLLYALLQPDVQMKAAQDAGDFTSRLMLQEQVKTLPFGDVWQEYCRRQSVPAEDGDWYAKIKAYEQEVLVRRK